MAENEVGCFHHVKNMKETEEELFTYNEMVKDDESVSSLATYRDIMEYLTNSDDTCSTSSHDSYESSAAKSNNSDTQNLNICFYVTKNFISNKGNQLKKKYHTTGYAGNVKRNSSFSIEKDKNVSKLHDKIKSIRKYEWKPLGRGVPPISSIQLSHKKAWDIGKVGCNGLVIESLLENYKKKQLNYMTMDGTNIDNFLTIYTHTYQDTVRGVEPSILHCFSFYDLEKAQYFYDIKSMHIFIEKKKKKKTIILRNLNGFFFDAILVCMNEIIIHFKISAFKKRIAQKDRQIKKRIKETVVNERIHYVKSAKNEKNVYINSIKDVLYGNKRKGKNSEQEKGKVKGKEKCAKSEITNGLNTDSLVLFNETIESHKLSKKKETNYTSRNSNSIKSEDSCYNCFSDILNKEKREMEKKGVEGEDFVYNDNTSHTSESEKVYETKRSVSNHKLCNYNESIP